MKSYRLQSSELLSLILKPLKACCAINTWKLLILLLILLFNPACDRIVTNKTVPQVTPSYSTQKQRDISPLAMVAFSVQVPADPPLTDPIYIYILDEVTGLGLAPIHYEMQPTDNNVHTIGLPFPVGSVIKYRYARKGDFISTEQSYNKQQVRYRLFLVEGPSEINDVVSAWSDTPFIGPKGRINGQAVDASNGAPLPGILISVGGQQTFTNGDGTFLVEGLPPGLHNLVAYTLDGSYKPYQQGASILSESTTPTPLKLTANSLVNIVFTLEVPPDTMPGVPIRIAGSLYQFGNTFADLAGGVSTIASRMPVLSPLPDGRYSTSIALPAGAYVEYKYTLGDGFWNSEHIINGDFRLRKLIIPDKNTIIEDQVESWGTADSGPIIFDITTPSTTPPEDTVSIQFNPFGWTEPIPMWKLADHHWVYVLISPLNVLERFGYRYCRNDQCGSADDLLTMGNESFGRILELGEGEQIIQETVGDWVWMDPNLSSASLLMPAVTPRPPEFIAGIQFQPYNHPSWLPHYSKSFEDIISMNANWLFFSPTWTYSIANPPVFSPISASDILWKDSVTVIQQALDRGLNVAINPTPFYKDSPDNWWSVTTRDFSWWVVWFDQYHEFALHHARLAQQAGAQMLVLGGDWLLPALPDGVMADGTDSSVPADAETRWREIISEVKQVYQGDLVWAIPFTDHSEVIPAFLDLFDRVMIDWSPVLSQNPSASEFELYTQTATYLDQFIYPIKLNSGLPIIIAPAFSSADGTATGCVPDPHAIYEGVCIDSYLLSRPNPDIPTILRDMDEQMLAYNATLTAVNERDWIDGIVARGYYPPAALQDKSNSMHGKPAGDLINNWFAELTYSAP